MLSIGTQFDAGAIEVIEVGDPLDIRLRLRPDTAADIRQWFHFRLQGAKQKACRLRFLDAGQSAYPDGWRDYRVAASYDRKRWFRMPDTFYDGEVLTIECTPRTDSLYFAYFEPYSWERHLDLLGRIDAAPLARVERLGSTLEGRDSGSRHRRHAGSGQAQRLGDRAPAPGRDHGRVVRRGHAGAPAGRRRPGGAAASWNAPSCSWCPT